MGVFKRGDKWRASVGSGPDRIWSKTYPTKREAQTWERITNTDRDRGELRLPRKGQTDLLFEDFADIFLSHAQSECRPRTYQGYRSRVHNSLMAAFRGRRLRQITRAEIAQWREAKLLAPCTRHKKCLGGHKRQANADLDVLRALLGYAVQTGRLEGNPAALIERGRKPERKVSRRVYSPAEVQALLARMPVESDEYGLVLTAFSTGLRPATLMAMRIEWVDWDRRLLLVPGRATKDGDPLGLPLPDLLIAWLRGLKRTAGLLWPSRQLGRKDRQLADHKTRLADIRQYLGPAFLLYDCRHTYLTHINRAGIRLPATAAAGGHSDVRTAMIYQGIDQDDLTAIRGAATDLVGDGRAKLLALKKKDRR
ncbi:MAG: tyrosine-type recombinase/integrase [Candidatus Wallbacteria bacterium]|nr:tyrosine-type recombinase/integrase [Candidatus Wallbacteria bacterium]